MDTDEILMQTEEKMDKTLQKVKEDFQGVRTGKASPALVENIKVDCYGSTMRLRETAGITTPEPRLIMIQPWDASNVDPIRKAIEEANIGITPMVDGKIIRLPIPELSEERRKDLIKVVKKMGEDGKIAIRHARRDCLDQLKKEEKASTITQDDLKVSEKSTQDLTDKFVKQIDEMVGSKEKELLTI
ncbi:MAG: ribosome recycling factor [Verrucomicrobiota bacterium]